MSEHRAILDFICQHYGLMGDLKNLPSYIDQNYLFKTNNDEKQYVVKLSSPQTSLNEIELENAAMSHVISKGIELNTPQVIPSLSGDELLEFKTPKGVVLWFRIVTFLSGQLYCEVRSPDLELPISLGESIAELTEALADFKHPAAYRIIDWDIAQLLRLQPYLKFFKGEELELLQRNLDLFKNHTLEFMLELPTQINHNDANDHNLVVSQVKGKYSCTGLFDFGDMVYTQRINELAIAMAYALMSREDVLTVSKKIVAGYEQKIKLTDFELGLLPQLIKARLVQSLLNSGKCHAINPNNEYLLISAAPAWELLKKLDKLDEITFIESICL